MFRKTMTYRGENAAISTDETPTGSGKETALLVIALVVCIIVWAALDDHTPVPPETAAVVVVKEEAAPIKNYEASCQANKIIAGSLWACARHSRCGLTIDETAVMYRAGKASIIDCKKAELIEALLGGKEEEPQIERKREEVEVISI